MDIHVRLMEARDRPAWAEMRAALWPEESAAEHAHGIDELLRNGRAWGFVAEVGGVPAGFAELAIRDMPMAVTASRCRFSKAFL
jgi:hypothetical protein